MFSEVIVGVDGRAGGRDAVALARLLVAPAGRLTLVHVHSGRDGDEQPLATLERERETAEVDAGLAAVAAPSVGRGLHEFAATSGADLLVVGSCMRGFAGRVLVGNDTRAAMTGAPCAIAVAPLAYARDLSGLATVGVGYDASPESVAALELARELAAAHGARLRALTVVQLPAAPWSGFATVTWGPALDDLLAGAQTSIAGLDDVEGEAVLGIAGEELAAFGARVDVLVVGSRGYGPVRRLMLGSTSEYLAGHARCPLVVLPRRSGDLGTAARPGERRRS
jgi:nucleotide-binding universal stress UspA family protein